MKFVFTILALIFGLVSCTQSSKDNEAKKRMDRSFKSYIRNNDIIKDLSTDLKLVRILSFESVSTTDPKEKYQAKIHMRGTSSYNYSAKIYNIDDTVSCYFDESYNMLRLDKQNNNH